MGEVIDLLPLLKEQQKKERRFELLDKGIMTFFSTSMSWVQDFEGNIKE